MKTKCVYIPEKKEAEKIRLSGAERKLENRVYKILKEAIKDCRGRTKNATQDDGKATTKVVIKKNKVMDRKPKKTKEGSNIAVITSKGEPKVRLATIFIPWIVKKLIEQNAHTNHNQLKYVLKDMIADLYSITVVDHLDSFMEEYIVKYNKGWLEKNPNE